MNEITQHIVSVLSLIIETPYKLISDQIAVKLDLPENVLSNILHKCLVKYGIIFFKRLNSFYFIHISDGQDLPMLLDEIKEHGWPPPSLIAKRTEINKKAKANASAKTASEKAKSESKSKKTPDKANADVVLQLEQSSQAPLRVCVYRNKPKQSGPYKNEPKQKCKVYMIVTDKWPDHPKRPEDCPRQKWKDEILPGRWRQIVEAHVKALVEEHKIPYNGPFVKRYCEGRRDSPFWMNRTASNIAENISGNILIKRLFGGTRNQPCGYFVDTREDMARWTTFLNSKQRKKFTQEQLSGPHPSIKEYNELLEKHPKYEGKYILLFPVLEEPQE